MDIFLDQVSKDIILDTNLDLVDLLVTEDDAEQLMQRLFIRFKTYIRDLWWDKNVGIDFLNTFFGINKKKYVLDALIKKEIKSEVMVSYFDEDAFSSVVEDYNYSCKFRVKVANSETLTTYFFITNESGLILSDQDGNMLTGRVV